MRQVTDFPQSIQVLPSINRRNAYVAVKMIRVSWFTNQHRLDLGQGDKGCAPPKGVGQTSGAREGDVSRLPVVAFFFDNKYHIGLLFRTIIGFNIAGFDVTKLSWGVLGGIMKIK